MRIEVIGYPNGFNLPTWVTEKRFPVDYTRDVTVHVSPLSRGDDEAVTVYLQNAAGDYRVVLEPDDWRGLYEIVRTDMALLENP